MELGENFDLVTSRAVASPNALFEMAGRALRREGVLMLYVSSDQKFDDDTGAAASAGLFDRAVSGYDLRHGRQETHRAIATWTRR